jgi:branched-chain amino acid transport system substrate-binding protein
VTNRRTKLLAAAIVILVVLGAGAYYYVSQTSVTSKAPIRIGFTVALTGPFAASGVEVLDGYTAWQTYVNSHGGLLGRQVQFVYYDDASDPNKGAGLYEKLITVDKVDLVLGPYSSPITFATSTVTEKYHYVMVEPLGLSSAIFTRGYKYIFVSSPSLIDNASICLVRWINDNLADSQRPKTYAVIIASDLVSVSYFNGFKNTYAPQAGLQNVFSEQYPVGTTDLTPLILKVKQANPDIVFLSSIDEPSIILAIRTMKRLDFKPKLFYGLDTLGLPRVRQELGNMTENIMFNVFFHPSVKYPVASDFISIYRTTHNNIPEGHSAQAFAAGQILQQAVEGTKSLDNEKIRDYLLTNRLSTVYGPMEFRENGTPKNPVDMLGQWQNGQIVILWPSNVATAKQVYPFEWGA